MMRRIRTQCGWEVAVGTIAVAMLLISTHGQASERQDNIKAAFIFNFARFTEWPADGDAGAGDPMVVCRRDDHPLAAALRTIDGEMIGEREIDVVGLPTVGGDIGRCHILLLAAGEAVPRARGLLTVSEAPGFVDRDGAIELVQVGRQVRFQINETNLRRAGLRVSSRLLRLAIRVVK